MSDFITPHFSWAEASVTSTGIPNEIPSELIGRVIHTAHQMELVRACLLRRPIKVNSWYRSPQVNKAVGGSTSSEHMSGAAVDFVCPSYGTPKEVASSLIQYSHILNYNQLIYEQTWVHISFPPDGERGKQEVLTYQNGKYSKGII